MAAAGIVYDTDRFLPLSGCLVPLAREAAGHPEAAASPQEARLRVEPKGGIS